MGSVRPRAHRTRGRHSAAPLPEAGQLVPIEAIDRSGAVVTSEGAFVRILQVSPRNPIVMSESDRAGISAGLAGLVGRLRAGQSLQIYVEAAPVRLDDLLEESRRESNAVVQAMATDPRAASKARALQRLARAHEESILTHAYYQSAVELGVYVVVPYLPDAPLHTNLRAALPHVRRSFPTAPLKRSLDAHRRAMRESLIHTDGIRSELDQLELHARLLTGAEVAHLLYRRLNPTAADRGLGRPVEIHGELDAAADASTAVRAARGLREQIAASALDFSNQRHIAVDRDLEQIIYVAGMPDVTYFGWLMSAMTIDRPFALTVHVHALDRLQERQRLKAKRRRLFGVNRASLDRPSDFEMLDQESELDSLLHELSGHQRASIYEVSIYQSLREPGPDASSASLAEAVDTAARELMSVSDTRIHRGEFIQQDLWQSTLPLGRDVARRVRKYVSRHVGDTLPVIGTHCGSPTGIPFAFSEPGRTIERLNPWDPAHDNMTLLINGKSGSGKTLATNVILSRLLAYGVNAFVLDRAGHYAFLCELIPGARHLTIGAGSNEHAVNPWDTADPDNVPPEKVTFLVGLHAILVGDRQGASDAYGISALERNLLEVAIRAVFVTAANEKRSPLERDLRAELERRAGDEDQRGAVELAGQLRNLAERLASFVGDGSYAYLLDRPTTVPEDAPLVVFDTRRIPRELTSAVIFILAEHVTSKIERHRARSLAADSRPSMFPGDVLVIDETWSLMAHRATGEWLNDTARRARHLGLFLVAITQQLSDFANEYGRALLRNSSMQLFLRQAPDELRYVQDALRLSEEEIVAIARLRTAKGEYSRAYWINGTRGRATVTLRVGATEYWLATSDPVGDVPRREQAIREHNGDPWAALDALAGRA
ncbi:MAG: conjugal transfer ATP-binding protein TraC [Solirubrobacteraceae bacterium]